MNKVVVNFGDKNREYTFKTNLRLRAGCIYEIHAACGWYKTPAEVVRYTKVVNPEITLKTIDKAKMLVEPKKRINLIKDVYFNEEKRTTVVVWADGEKTKVVCNKDDTFSRETGLALCVMKRAFDNNGSYNEILKKYCYPDKQ